MMPRVSGSELTCEKFVSIVRNKPRLVPSTPGFYNTNGVIFLLCRKYSAIEFLKEGTLDKDIGGGAIILALFISLSWFDPKVKPVSGSRVHNIYVTVHYWFYWTDELQQQQIKSPLPWLSNYIITKFP